MYYYSFSVVGTYSASNVSPFANTRGDCVRPSARLGSVSRMLGKVKTPCRGSRQVARALAVCSATECPVEGVSASFRLGHEPPLTDTV